MKRILIALALTGFFVALHASDSRIIALGRHDAFFMDDYSIFRNPANVNVYPNMVFGSGGYYSEEDNPVKSTSSSDLSALRATNRDPVRPYAGGIVSYSLNQSAEGGNQYPMISIGAAFNRYDKMLQYLIPGTPEFSNAFSVDSSFAMPRPVGKIDLMGGYALANGGMIGFGSYLAFQNDSSSIKTASLYKGTLGLNMPIAKATDLEVSVGIGAVNAIGTKKDVLGNVMPDTLASASGNSDFMLEADGRIFQALTVLNGDIVPHLKVNMVNLKQFALFEIACGVGMNINVDKGFGWAGLEFLYEQKDLSPASNSKTATDGYGGRVSFGFERNIIWDWFLLRAGICKKLLYVKNGSDGYWLENAEADKSDNDFLGIGVGANIENRLKIDAVIAEDVLFTFTNLISKPQDHILTRFSASYSF